jgi:hypothetical protein
MFLWHATPAKTPELLGNHHRTKASDRVSKESGMKGKRTELLENPEAVVPCALRGRIFYQIPHCSNHPVQKS